MVTYYNVVSTYIIGFTCLAPVENDIYGFSMILNVQPVANIFTLSINRDRLIVLDVINSQWNKFLGELIGPIVIGTV